MQTVAVIAVRLGSTRLPEKAILPVRGKPMIERMIERVQRAKTIDEIVIATTTLDQDDRLEELADRVGVESFRGPEEDVLGRIAGAVQAFEADRVVELLGDNPLIHGDLIDDVVALHEEGGHDFTANATTEHPEAAEDAARFAIGVRAEVYEPEVVQEADRQVTDPARREHSTRYIWENPDVFDQGYLQATGRWKALNRPDLTFAVNYRQNLEMVREIFDELYPKNPNFGLDEVMGVVQRRSSLTDKMGAPT